MAGFKNARLGFSHYPVASFAETIQVPSTICHIFAKKCVNDKRGHFVLIRSSAAYASLWGEVVRGKFKSRIKNCSKDFLNTFLI